MSLDQKNSEKKILITFFFFVLISFVLIFLFTQHYSNSFNPVFIIDEYFDKNTIAQNLPNCSIYLAKKKQHKVLINGSYYPKSIPLFDDKSINFECLQDTQTFKTILLWTPFFGSKDYGLTLGKETEFIKSNCPVTKCELTNDKRRLGNADLIVVHMRNSVSKIPLERYGQQRWVFTLYESPVHSPNFKRFNGIFNLTATYRIDSDFPGLYSLGSRMKWVKNENFDLKRDFYAGKTDFAAAVISNCNDRSKRLKFIRELQKYILVNVFGKCGKPCPVKFKNSTFADCKKVLATEYKFYFAFENSICKDYITEKFFAILKYDIIPVVYGGGPYDYYVGLFIFLI